MLHDKTVAILGLLATALTTGQALELGERLYQPDGSFLDIASYAERVQENGFLLRRQDLLGSWALRAPTCPKDTITCDSKPTSGNACCVSGSTCVGYGYRIACCPSEDRCDETAETIPRCSDPSWSLWQGGRDVYFCCLQDQTGFVTINQRGACGPSELSLTGSAVATQIAASGSGSPQPKSTDDSGDSSSSKTSTTPSSSSSSSSPSTVSTDPIYSTTAVDDPPTSSSDYTSGSNGNKGSQYDSTHTPSPNSGGDTSSSSGSSGLSTGTIAGIAAGGVALLVLAVVGIVFALRAGKKKGKAQAMAAIQTSNQVEPRVVAGNIFPSTGSSTPFQPPPFQPPPFQQPSPQSPFQPPRHEFYAQDSQSKGEAISQVAPVGEYGADPRPSPSQWNPSHEVEGNVRHEADSVNQYQSASYAEMEANARRAH